MTSIEALLTIPPSPSFWMTVQKEQDLGTAEDTWATAGLCVRRVRGQKMKTYSSLMDEVAAALQFPWYFGQNWDALNDCLSDVEWLLPAPALVVVIANAGEVLAAEPADHLRTFVEIVNAAAVQHAKPSGGREWWNGPAVPFHCVLHATKDDATNARQRWADASAVLEALPSLPQA